MIKVFLVEDEIVMREGIKNNIDWQSEGLEFVGEASDGELAYPLIKQSKPDILITDIHMPFMDGLELSRLVKKELPDIKIVILSGYDEFEYAKEAISIGVTDYLVKPVTGAKLLEAVKEIAAKLEEENRQKEYLLTFEKESQENRQLERLKLFERLISGRESTSVLLEEASNIGMNLVATQYSIILFRLFANGETEGYFEDENRALMQIEELLEAKPHIQMIERGQEGLAFLLMGNQDLDLSESITQFCKELVSIVEKYSGIEYFGGIGSVVSRLSELGACFELANKAFAYRYIKERNKIISYDLDESQETQGVQISSINVKNLDRKITESFIKTGLRDEVENFINEYFHTIGDTNIQSGFFRQYLAMDMYIATLTVLEEIGYSSDELEKKCGDTKSLMKNFSSIEDTKQYLLTLLRTAIDLRDTVARKKYDSLIEEAIVYIEENYANDEISLNMVAANVNLSPNHFSTIFSQEVGQTFIGYLTNVRMDKAKELLRTTSMKTAEISYTVGYKDPHYFSYLFKKTQDQTPREYRVGAKDK